MASIYERFIPWRASVGEAKFARVLLSPSNIKPITDVIDWVNLTRATEYYSNIPNSSKTEKYRKKTNTQRTKQRNTYIRASEFGGKREEQVISSAPGEMSEKTINELTSSFLNLQTGRGKILEFNEFDKLTQGILGKFGSGQMPKGTQSKLNKAYEKYWANIGRAMARDGF